MINVVYFGTEDISVPTLQTLIDDNKYNVVGVVTKPDSARGRGHHIDSPAVAKLAQQHNITCLQPSKLRDVTELLESLRADVGALVSYGKIIPQDVIDIFPHGIVNFHPSMLPVYRGPSPIETAIMHGDSLTGLTLMALSKDMDAGDIMTHRVDMTAVEADEPVTTVIQASIKDGYSRIPVYDDDPDNIVGIVYVKDLLKFIGEDLPKTTTIRQVMREAYFVPETKKCGELFAEMTEKRIQMSIIVDEYGGTAGIVTIEDIIESIVGNIRDEYDEDDEEISKINDNIYTVDGITDIDEVDELIGAKLPEGDYDTIGGFVISQLGYLPTDGNFDTVEYENLKFTVLSVEERRIEKIKIEIFPREDTANANGDTERNADE